MGKKERLPSENSTLGITPVNSFLLICILTIFFSQNLKGVTVKNPFRASCSLKLPTLQLSPFGLQVDELLKPYVKSPKSSWMDELKKFDRCAESKNPVILKIKKNITDAVQLKSQGRVQEAQKAEATADAQLKAVAGKPFPATTPDSPKFIPDLESWWIDIATSIDLKLAICQNDQQASAFIDGISASLTDWGTQKIDEILALAEYAASLGMDPSDLIQNMEQLWIFLENHHPGFDENGRLLKKISDGEIRIYDVYLRSFIKTMGCYPSEKDITRFRKVVDRAVNLINLHAPDKKWEESLTETMKQVMIPYYRSVAMSTPASAAAKWKAMESWADCLHATDFMKELKSRKVAPPECFAWAGTIKYRISWNDISTTTSNTPPMFCNQVKGIYMTKDTVSRVETITFPGTVKNTPVATLNCREIAVINNHTDFISCNCACGKDGHDNCEYAYTADLTNWILESVVSASPVVNCDWTFDPGKKSATIFFENQPVKYVRHSRNGKEKYSNIKSPCHGLPGPPADYSGDTPEEGYALMDSCVIALDPAIPDQIVGKCHLDQPKPTPFWDQYTKNLQKEVAKGGSYAYQLNNFQYDIVVDLRKVKVK